MDQMVMSDVYHLCRRLTQDYIISDFFLISGIRMIEMMIPKTCLFHWLEVVSSDIWVYFTIKRRWRRTRRKESLWHQREVRTSWSFMTTFITCLYNHSSLKKTTTTEKSKGESSSILSQSVMEREENGKKDPYLYCNHSRSSTNIDAKGTLR